MVPQRPGTQKLAVVMVGLPARGKTFVARKIQGYLSWLGYRTLWVNVGDYRRARAGAKQPAAYFAPDNTATRGEREGFGEGIGAEGVPRIYGFTVLGRGDVPEDEAVVSVALSSADYFPKRRLTPRKN